MSFFDKREPGKIDLRSQPAAATRSRPVPSRETSNVLWAEMLSELRTIAQTFTSFAARLQGRLVNDVLEVRTVAIPTAGYVALDYHAAAGAITVSNPGANTVTVVAAGPSPDGVAPATGTGIYKVPGSAAAARTVPVGSRQITIYGTTADVVSFVVWAAAPIPVV